MSVMAEAAARRPPPAARQTRPATPSGPKPVKPIRADVTDAPRRPSPAARRVRQAIPTEKAHRGSYQPVILAEFVAAIVLTAATPIASNKNQAGLSPYVASDVAQLAGLTILYLVLALVSTGGSTAGRLSAWFGGLILLGVGLGEASTIAKTLNIFGSPAGAPATAPTATAPVAAPATTTTSPGTGSPAGG